MKVQQSVPRFFAPDTFAAHGSVTVGEDAARHMRALRIGPGSAVFLLDGQGGRATGRLRVLAKRSATIEVEQVETVLAAPAVHALVPIADRDRMLWFAEKAAELELASWRPVMWKRSRSVSPKGEGSVFHGKLRARMASALEQSGNAWLPMTYPEATPERALASLPASRRLVLDVSGDSIVRALARSCEAPLAIAVGPEGGFEGSEMLLLLDAGFECVSLGSMTLRFETAGIAALAHARAALATAPTNALTTMENTE